MYVVVTVKDLFAGEKTLATAPLVAFSLYSPDELIIIKASVNAARCKTKS
jgi:hypothetical protein